MIDRFCKTPDVYHEILAAFVESGPMAAAKVSREAKANGICVKLPLGAAVRFEGREIVKRYAKGLDGPEVVISGTLPTGMTVFIWVDKSAAPDFLPPES
ncbi:MAG: hypothetical protein D6773_05605 [Alphaproteobacteria bacterium]|nr:MAG: hypothetical protein D6773_05605 [Alphaproteobacteria bacterium]